MDEIRKQARQAVTELLEVARLQPGDILETAGGNYRICGIASMNPLESQTYGAGETPILLRQSAETRT